MKKMTLKERAKAFAKENSTLLNTAFLAGCVAGYVGLTVWEMKHLKTVYLKDWEKVTGEGPFDQLLDKPIVSAFATVEYNDGEIGVIENVQSVAARLAETVTIE